MCRTIRDAVAAAGLTVCLACAHLPAATPTAPPPDELARTWDAEHVSSPISPLVTHAEVVDRLARLPRTDDGGLFTVREVGRSVEGRPISMVSFGAGPFPVLLWSQMHGDEPTATSALFDLYEYVSRHRDIPVVRTMLEALTVHTVPMLNPDGAERWQRRNTQGLDVNRDALLLQSPEGQLLKRLRDELEPRVGFNLHNQNWSTTAGRPPMPAAISLLSVAYDEARSVSEGRMLTKRLGAVVRDALEPLAPGRIGRYDDGFEVRAFGDNITLWGTPVLLIETGPWPTLNPDPPLVRINFVALVAALSALADGSVHRADPARYDSLPENESRGFYYLVRNVTIRAGRGVPPFVGDVGIGGTRRVRVNDDAREVFVSLSVSDLGDLRTHVGLFEVDGTGKVLAPAIAGLDVGATISADTLDGAQVTLQTGSPANLMLLVPIEGAYRVERLIVATVPIRD
ncbi:MAG TPA: M14 family zinc carboxypeptidase [Vicinamibacterales bacterium]|nr:M14 family zinc carboxypeptidase [Vicinamibacterales bacterium]